MANFQSAGAPPLREDRSEGLSGRFDVTRIPLVRALAGQISIPLDPQRCYNPIGIHFSSLPKRLLDASRIADNTLQFGSCEKEIRIVLRRGIWNDAFKADF